MFCIYVLIPLQAKLIDTTGSLRRDSGLQHITRGSHLSQLTPRSYLGRILQYEFDFFFVYVYKV